MYHKILVPLDGTKRAERILDQVEELAHDDEAQIILLRVIDPVPSYYTEALQSEEKAPLQNQREIASVNYLDPIDEDLENRRVRVTKRVATGPVVETIINVAEQENVDLIAMASHARTGLSRMFNGSVTDEVLHATNRPMLVVRSLDD
ncbi:MAG: universal stress protein [Anaerolineae bacterium]|nr:universal stress protein [Anaerolineae bacterium]